MDSLPSLNLLYHSKIDTRFMQDALKEVWSIPYISVAFFPSLKQNFIAYRSSKVSSHPDCIFEIHRLWQSGFSRVYSNSCCSCSFELEILKIGQSSHKMHSNNILNFQEFMTILNVCTKRYGKLLNAPRIYIYIYIYINYQSKVFVHPQKFLYLILKVLFLMKQVKHHNVFIYHTNTTFP